MFKLNPFIKNPYPFPYRLVFAIASKDKILVYDTQQEYPIAEIKDIHYAGLSDLCWSVDGQVLLATSTDGYCTFVYFAEGELGEFYEGEPYKYEVITETKKSASNTTGVAAKKAAKEKALKEKVAKKEEAVTKENQLAEKTPSIKEFLTRKPNTPLVPQKLENSFHQVANKSIAERKDANDCLVIKEIASSNVTQQQQSTNDEPRVVEQPMETGEVRPVSKPAARRIAPTLLSKPLNKSIFSQTANGYQSASNKNDENLKSNTNSLKRNIGEEGAGSEKKKKRIQPITIE